MKIVRLSYPLEFPIADFPDGPHVMAIGDFDGVHLGHQDVIHSAIQNAKKHNVASSIMTFDPHPREVLGQTQYARYLAPLQKKIKLFEAMGIDYAFMVSFTSDFAKVSPEDFVHHMIFLMNVHRIVVGFDFTFGHKGMGTVETLKQLCDGRMEVEVVKPYNLDGQKVSSTFIREQLHLGRLDLVHKFLGRNYLISGHVVTGEGRGRTIGFPTANIEVNAPYVIPKYGVYAVKLNIEGEEYRGVMNIGVKPTFSAFDMNPTLEVFIFDFSQDIYGKEVIIEFVSFIRDEEKFSSVDKLVQQINEDVEQARQILEGCL